MRDPVELRFSSKLAAPPDQVWTAVVSVEGLRREMRPFLRMTIPRGVASLDSLEVMPGRRLFRSYLLAFGVIPFDYSDLTLIELRPGRGFLEQSPMGSMRLWRHERRIDPVASDPGCSVVTDRLTFTPRFAAPLAAWIVHRFFEHRHAVLRRHFGPTA